MNKENDNVYDDTEILKIMNDFGKEMDKIIDDTVDEILKNKENVQS